MLRNCAAILFVCFDMTACDALTLFSRPAALDYETLADREGRQSRFYCCVDGYIHQATLLR